MCVCVCVFLFTNSILFLEWILRSEEKKRGFCLVLNFDSDTAKISASCFGGVFFAFIF